MEIHKIIHCSKQYPRTDKSLIHPDSIQFGVSSKVDKNNIIEVKEKLDISSDSNSQVKSISVLNSSKTEELLKNCEKCPKDYTYWLNFVRKCNSIIFDLNNKMLELERSVSILFTRLAQIENFYSIQK